MTQNEPKMIPYCSTRKRGRWLRMLDIEEHALKEDEVILKNHGVYGECNRECGTIRKACGKYAVAYCHLDAHFARIRPFR